MAKVNEQRNAAARMHPASRIFGIILIFLVVAVYMLYPVLRDYYVAYRDNSSLLAEREAILTRNDRIREQIESLGTPEGIADRAREEFGWVAEGEEAVNITGLGNLKSSTSLPSLIEPGSGQAPVTWLTVILDTIFGVSDAKPVNPDQDDVIPGL